ncbi:MAG: hypothetical protein JO033_19000, partial [Acidobacteriaceae bacterium]|nr:hypothetical protein [Acidobacteriaceae bacterium]
FIGWNREHPKGKSEPPVASYSVDLPSGLAHDWNLNARSALALSIAVTDENAPPPGKKSAEKDASKKQQKQKPEWTDFSIELTTGDGITSRLPLSNFRGLLPPLKVQFTKVAYLDGKMYEKASEPIFQTVAMPLSAFATQNTNFDPSKLKAIRLKFDRTQSRVIILSEIAFEQPLP